MMDVQFRLFATLSVLLMLTASCHKNDDDLVDPVTTVEEGEMVVEGGGQFYSKKVFIDLSENIQTAVDRTSWDLGFYTGAEFRVVLNASNGMMAKQIAKNDLNEVNASDTAGFSEQMSFNAFSPDALPYIDYPDGDLNKTAIAEVSANAGDNKVYIINKGTGPGSPPVPLGWKKVRIVRNASGGYTLQHADIDAATFSEVDVPKTEEHYFNYISFDDGAVEPEPEKDKWDFAWTFFSNVTAFGAAEIPYTFQDFIVTNRNVQTAMVRDSVIAYDAFAEADLGGLSYSSAQNSIGADWRSGGGPNTSPAIREDRYYVVKDANGNYYKVKFTSLTRNGERGYPSFKFDLVKKAAQ